MKEYFTSSYEQKRREKLIEINNKYNALIPTYTAEKAKSPLNVNKIAELEVKLTKMDEDLITELDNYVNLLDSQVDMLKDKKTKLDEIENKLIELKNSNLQVSYDTNLEELKERNISEKKKIIVMIIICIILVILFFFFALPVLDVIK